MYAEENGPRLVFKGVTIRYGIQVYNNGFSITNVANYFGQNIKRKIKKYIFFLLIFAISLKPTIFLV